MVCPSGQVSFASRAGETDKKEQETYANRGCVFCFCVGNMQRIDME